MNKKKWIALIVACLMAVAVLAGCSGRQKVAAKVNGTAITRPIFAALYTVELSKLYEEAPEGLSFDNLSKPEFIDDLKNAKNAEGQSYYDQLIEDTLEQCQLLIVNLQLAKKSKDWPSKKEMNTEKANIKEEIEAYAEYNEIEDADQFCIMAQGLPMKDYIEFYGISYGLDKYNSAKMKAMEVLEADLREYYNAHVDDYEDLHIRTVRVRHSLFKTAGLSDAELTALKAKVDGYVAAYEAGTMTMDEIVALSADVDQNGKPNYDGYYDVTENSNFVDEFEDWAMKQETASDTIEVIETEHGYHVMQCTKVWTLGFDDASVKDVVDLDYRAELLEQELKDLITEKKYEIQSRNDKVIDSFVKQVLTGSYEGSSPLPQTSSTPKPVDAAASETYVGTLGDAKLWSSDYKYFFTNAFTEIVMADYTSNTELSEKEQYDALIAFLDTPYKNESITYLEKCKARALELYQQFLVTYNVASADSEPLTNKELASLDSEVDSFVDQYLSYYGANMGISTRDEMMDLLMAMNVNEYKRLNRLQHIVSEFSEKKMEEMKPTQEDLRNYYNQNKDDFRVVTVRHIFLSLVDDKGKAVSAEKKASVTAIANQLVQKIKDGDSPELLVEAWSEHEEAPYDLGLVDLRVGSKDLDEAIVKWAVQQTAMGKTVVKLFETKTGYEIVVVEGILEFNGQRGIAAGTDTTVDGLKTAVETAYKNDQFQKLVDGFVAASDLKVENLNQEEIDKVADEYLTYTPSKTEDEA
ncbi:MAG: peptidyl-prolyl cis-trans isomerase [Clostridia bacterium]|nr:peptidyl-prolyl cis-trans isomerase [Clostridia bacterium]